MADELYIYVPDFAADATAIKKELGTKVDAESVTCETTLVAALGKYTNVKQLTFNTHGKSGEITLPKSTLMIDGFELLKIGKKVPNLMAPMGRILFMSCATGDGTDGDTFMDNVAKGFLIH